MDVIILVFHVFLVLIKPILLGWWAIKWTVNKATGEDLPETIQNDDLHWHI